MKRFSAKNLVWQSSFGEVLRQARERLGLNLAQVSFHIKIPVSYLQSLEQESLIDLPAGLYGRKFLLEYATYLGLESAPLLAEYSDRQKNSHQPEITKRSISRWQMFPWFRLLLISVAGVLFIYLIWEATSLFLPPPLSVLNPPADVTVESLSINVVGRTDPGARVLLNGESVSVSTDGDFQQEVVLQPGLNTIEILASRGYSQPTRVVRQVLTSVLPKN